MSLISLSSPENGSSEPSSITTISMFLYVCSNALLMEAYNTSAAVLNVGIITETRRSSIIISLLF
ncbi:hypothetical protein MCHI_001348 [Candidatus Magnetoovum chiemensis]|nr:hypothetical protein MCHI_001348 [Candidatus Magnetoovum chiemensis]